MGDKSKLAFTWLKNSLMSAMQDLVIVVQRKLKGRFYFMMSLSQTYSYIYI